MTINSITKREIKELTAIQLTQLLQMLLHLEINRYNLTGFYYVSQNITASDGGEDGRITVDDPKESNYIKNKLTIFQCKANNLFPSKIEKEFTEIDSITSNRILKPVIQNVLDLGGQYILFMCSDASSNKGIQARADKMFNVCKSLGHNYKRKQFAVYDGQKISEWANDYISTVTYLLECNGRSRSEIFRTYKQWGDDIQFKIAFPFQGAAIASKMQELKTMLDSSNAVRVIGHSGIGKTRLVYECLKGDPSKVDVQQNKLNASVVYYDNALIPNNDLIKHILSFKDQHVATIVIDNCPNDLHVSLATILRSNPKIKIITLDYSLETDEKYIIKLNKDEQQLTVNLMLEALYPNLPDSDIKRLALIAEGYPRMVELLSEVVAKNGITSIITELPREFVSKLVFGRDTHIDTELDIIKSCSIFSEFTFIDEEYEELFGDQEKLDNLKKQRDFIAQEVCSNPVKDLHFYKICRKFKNERNIIERRGTKYSVIPTPLAAHLAADWLLNYPPELFEEFSKRLVQVGLIESFCERLRSLDQIERAKTIVAKLWGPQGPFVAAEVLNTELGSRLFRSVVEVNPQVTADTLSNIFDEMPLKNILLWKEGRRNMVWALEKLVFRHDLFYQAGIVLARFAAAENEDFANNSFNQFLQLFHIFLPGTEANFEQRIDLLEYCIQQPEENFKVLAISSIRSAFKTHHFHRSGGADRQGFSTNLKDYQAKTWNEIHRYWSICFDNLRNLHEYYPELRKEIKSTIAGNLRGLFSQQQGQIVLLGIQMIRDKDTDFWGEAITALKLTLQYEKLNPENLSIAKQILDELSPKDWISQIRYIVSIPDWDYQDLNTSHKRAEDQVRQLILKIFDSEVDLITMLPYLLTGEQRRGIIFGKLLPEFYEQQLKLGNTIIDSLDSIDPALQTSDVLAGYMISCEQSVRDHLFNRLASSESLNRHLPYILRFGKISFEEVEQVVKLVEQKKIDISLLSHLSLSRGEYGLEIEKIILILQQIENLGTDGSWIALGIYNQLTYFEEKNWTLLKKNILNLILKHNYFLLFNSQRAMRIYEFCKIVSRLLEENNQTQFAKLIAKNLYKASKSEEFLYFGNDLEELAEVLLDNYFEDVWPIWSIAFLADGFEYMNFKSLLGAKNGNLGHSGLLFKEDFADRIIEWCKKNDPKGPKRIAYMMPVINTSKVESLWHPFARKMLNQFHDTPGFLNEVDANLGSFGWVGSSVPYLENIKNMMLEITDHKSYKVKKWAKSNIKYYERQIKIEKMNDEHD
ncbi:hypothetical protein [Algoriphagus sp.]|uniref:hypothetical protein n=1 Tax=Algoriphagus sp. TaxID=1872435 RepID=UPI003F726EAC